MHPDITRAVAAARVQDRLIAAERSGLVRQARHAKPGRALPRPFRRPWRRARPAPATATADAAGLAAISPAAGHEPADIGAHAGRRAA